MTGVTAIMAGAATVLPLAVVASNVSRTRQGATPDGVVTTVALPNTTITGGVGPYTQLWTRQSGDSPTISDDELLNPTWSATVNSGDPNVSVWRVTVTDAMSSTASFDITVTLTWVQV